MLTVPLVFLALSLIEMSLQVKLGPTAIGLGYLLVGYLLFNTLHVALTYFMLGHLPEFRLAFGQLPARERRWLRVRWTCAGVSVPLLFVALNSPLPSLWSLVVRGVVMAWPTLHNLRQMQGLSSAYGHLSSQGQPAKRLGCEKFGFALLLLCNVPLYIYMDSMPRTWLWANFILQIAVIFMLLINS
jgi:hypothetical protein